MKRSYRILTGKATSKSGPESADDRSATVTGKTMQDLKAPSARPNGSPGEASLGEAERWPHAGARVGS
jgi:hypothetical protein